MLEKIKKYLDSLVEKSQHSDVENEMYDILTEYNKAGFGLSVSDFIALRNQAVENIKERNKRYRTTVLILLSILVLLECVRELAVR